MINLSSIPYPCMYTHCSFEKVNFIPLLSSPSPYFPPSSSTDTAVRIYIPHTHLYVQVVLDAKYASDPFQNAYKSGDIKKGEGRKAYRHCTHAENKY